MVRVPIYKQSDGFCGPSCLRMALAYYGVNKSELEIAKIVGVNPRQGCEADRLVNASREFGFNGSFYQNRFSVDQLREICLEFPVIVDWSLPIIDSTGLSIEGHYSVAMELKKGKIHLADPYLGAERVMKVGDFVRLWYDHLGLHPEKPEDFFVRRGIVIKR